MTAPILGVSFPRARLRESCQTLLLPCWQEHSRREESSPLCGVLKFNFMELKLEGGWRKNF
jgi:hypothetical protein